MKRLTAKLEEQFAESAKLEKQSGRISRRWATGPAHEGRAHHEFQREAIREVLAEFPQIEHAVLSARAPRGPGHPRRMWTWHCSATL